MHTDTERVAFIDTIAAFPGQLTKLVDGLTAEQLTTAYLEGEWTVAQNVHHVVDSHMNSYVRLKLILTEENPPLKGYDQEVWATLVDAVDPDLEDSLTILRGLHKRWVMVWQNVKANQWERAGIHSEIGRITLDELLPTYAEHCEAHIDQISRTLAAGGIAVPEV